MTEEEESKEPVTAATQPMGNPDDPLPTTNQHKSITY